MPRSNVIFNLPEINQACAAALGRGGSLSEVFSIGTSAHPGPNGTKYLDLCATVPGKQGRLVVRFLKEMLVGQIDPLDDDEVARINSERGANKFGLVSKRDRDPGIKIQKYKIRVEGDAAGRPAGPLPGPEHESEYFKLIAYLEKFFVTEMTGRVKKKEVALEDPDQEEPREGTITVQNTKIVRLIQTHVSKQASKNAGMKLANPITRMKIKFDPKTGMAKKAEFYDFRKQYKDPSTGGPRFEALKFDGNPVTAHNVHNIASRSVVSGIANLDAICLSNMGISVPSEVEVLVVDPPVTHSTDDSDVFVDGIDGDGPGAPPPAAGGNPKGGGAGGSPGGGGSDTPPSDDTPPGTPPEHGSPKGGAPAGRGSVPEDDLTETLDELGLGD